MMPQQQQRPQQQQQQNYSYSVDVVMCIDGTGSMESMIDKVKRQAILFPDLFRQSMEASGRHPGALRVKVIVFRDYASDGNLAMVESNGFFDLMSDNYDEKQAFVNFVNSIEPQGGDDVAENALEAIALALRSEWTLEGGRYRRHAILLFTDAPALPLREKSRVAARNYPQGMPGNLAELQNLYLNGDPEYTPNYSPMCGRLIIFAPLIEGSAWEAIQTWQEQAWVVHTRQDGGCDDVDLEDALSILVGSF